jgi:hypothetical protein
MMENEWPEGNCLLLFELIRNRRVRRSLALLVMNPLGKFQYEYNNYRFEHNNNLEVCYHSVH